MFLIVKHGVLVTQKAEITREDLGGAKIKGHLVLDIVRFRQFDAEENKWVEFHDPLK